MHDVVLELLRDPLSEVTRAERRNLLLTAATAVIVTSTGLLPKKIESIGVEFSEADRSILLLLLGLAIVYFLVAFVLYGSSDFLTWTISRNKAWMAIARQQTELEKEPPFRTEDGQVFPAAELFGKLDEIKKAKIIEKARHVEAVAKRLGAPELPRYLPRPLSWLRGAFEFAFPVAFGLYALWAIATFARP